VKLLRTARPWSLALLVAVLDTVVGVSMPFAGWLLFPGFVVAWPVFPEGVHTGSGAGLSYLLTICFGNTLVWALAVLASLKMARRFRHGRETNASA
jgi:hypothetical protein